MRRHGPRARLARATLLGMRRLLASWAVLAAAAAAQGSLPVSRAPDTNDLNAFSPVPFGVAQARVQVFFEAVELPAAAFVANRLLLRYDAAGSGAGTAHSVARLTVRAGVTGLGVAGLGATFAANLTQPLTTVVPGVRLDYRADGAPSGGPKPFGGPNGQFRFAFAQPVAVAVPSGGAFAVELVVEGNSNAGLDGAALDLHLDASASQGLGAAQTNGRGCPAGPALLGSTLETLGAYQPGTAFTIFGANYPANTPVATLLTIKLLGAPLPLPLTSPVCWVYVDHATGVAFPLTISGGGGEIQAFGGENTIPIPKTPGLCGAVIYVQNAAPIPLWQGNGFGVQSSNYRTIVLGCPAPPQVKAWQAAHTSNAAAPVANVAFNGALAVRVE